MRELNSITCRQKESWDVVMVEGVVVGRRGRFDAFIHPAALSRLVSTFLCPFVVCGLRAAVWMQRASLSIEA
jgi:hypothetical protein